MSNRLAGSTSPYLRQHAEDLVAWHPWDAEAFREAVLTDRPVLLSCGYSACHWCHVMQRESFRDPTTAALINSRFVAVKVDRESRPDVDALYQDYVAATTGSSGWPLTVILTPDKRPLLGGTYFPREPRAGLPTFLDLLSAMDDAYHGERERMSETAASALEYLRAQAAPKPEGPIDRGMLDYAADFLVQIQDPERGGMKGAPKFPQLPIIEYLSRYHRLVPDAEIEIAVAATLTAIISGGIYDQLGGGVHRYAVDAAWRTPHFEKMLYDQGLLLSALAQGAAMTPEEPVRSRYRDAAMETAAFLEREMAAPGGGFHAALGADTGGVEGASYGWTREQLQAVLSPAQLEVAEAQLGAADALEGEDGVTIIRPRGRTSETDEVIAVLRDARASRPRPETDTKVLTAWNAIAARGLIEAGTAFGDAAMVDTGVDTARFLLERCGTADGVLRDPDDPSIAGLRLIEDAAHLASALLSASEATGESALAAAAAAVHQDTVERFAEGHQLYMTPKDTDLPVRPREQGDNAVPSGASTTIETAVRLGLASGDERHLAWARDALRQVWSVADFAPEQAGRALAAAALLELEGHLG